MTKVFVDGSAGTTGLRIIDRLEARKDVTLLRLPEEKRKDVAMRKEAMNEADVVFLCLPDDAAREAVSLIVNPKTAVIDTSTAHRTDPAWTYGFPELTGQRQKIEKSKRIANPGCHASGFISLVAPLTEAGILSRSARLSCFSLTGYSGGGKKMIAEYESADSGELLSAPRIYALGQTHKHLPEMQKVCGLIEAPAFCPIVAPYYSGMEVTVPVFGLKPEDLAKVYQDYYRSGMVRYSESNENGFMSSGVFSGRDDMQIAVFGNESRAILVARFDNLGKGASGAAIQNMNLLLGLPDNTGLIG